MHPSVVARARLSACSAVQRTRGILHVNPQKGCTRRAYDKRPAISCSKASTAALSLPLITAPGQAVECIEEQVSRTVILCTSSRLPTQQPSLS